MPDPADYPSLVFVLSLSLLWLSAWIGKSVLRGRRTLDEDSLADFGVVLTATLTLLGLIIGFSFSMAINRYDQRKTCEEAEANAMGTEYSRAGLLPAAEAARVRALLKAYLDQRVSFYVTRDSQRLRDIDAQTDRLQKQLWDAVEAPAISQPTPVVALAVAGMNDVLNTQGYTQAAWWNRIPTAAWALMMLMAMVCNAMVGYGARKAGARGVALLVLPLILSTALFLIADIDSPRGGIIHVVPQNLLSLAGTLH
jgi:hypothetical protein